MSSYPSPPQHVTYPPPRSATYPPPPPGPPPFGSGARPLPRRWTVDVVLGVIASTIGGLCGGLAAFVGFGAAVIGDVAQRPGLYHRLGNALGLALVLSTLVVGQGIWVALHPGRASPMCARVAWALRALLLLLFVLNLVIVGQFLALDSLYNDRFGAD
jgi:hypothetical protein